MPFEPSIRNWRVSPPNGGWNVEYKPPERPDVTVVAQGHTYKEVLAHIHRWRVNNQLPPSDAEVFSYCNIRWCQRDPIRCTDTSDPMPDVPPSAPRRTLTPAEYGRGIWHWLALFGVNFDVTIWRMSIDQTWMLLDPANRNNNKSGCAACSSHFAEFMKSFPPQKVLSAEEAAVWVWLSHNEANTWAGKAHKPTYRQAANLHGWVILSDQQFHDIEDRLRA